MRNAAHANQEAGKYERAYELWLLYLDKISRTNRDDLRQAAEACHHVGDAACEFDIRKELNEDIEPQLIKEAVSKNLYHIRDYKKAADIAELLFERHPSEADANFLRIGANVNEQAGKPRRTLDFWKKFITDYP